MGFCIKRNGKLAVKKESVENVYEAPLNGADFIQVTDDGVELNPSKEQLEIKVQGQGLAKSKTRGGAKSVDGSFKVYAKAGSSASSVTEIDVLLESLFGSKRNSTSITTGTGNTSSLLKVADTSSIKVGDIIIVKKAGAFHISPVKAVVANTSVELLIAAGASFADGVEIEAFTTYVPVNSGHPSFSVSKFVEDAILTKAIGCKTTSLSVDNFVSEQLPNFSLGFSGLDFDVSLQAPAVAPSYSTSECPIIRKACIYVDGVEIQLNELSLSIENTLVPLTSTCAGKFSSRVTERAVSGTLNPYKTTDSIANFTKWNSDTTFSLFFTMHNPSAVNGEFKEVISFYIPKCKFTEIKDGDIDGVLTDDLSFEAVSEDGSPEIYMTIS